jgi:hypothetical protein
MRNSSPKLWTHLSIRLCLHTFTVNVWWIDCDFFHFEWNSKFSDWWVICTFICVMNEHNLVLRAHSDFIREFIVPEKKSDIKPEFEQKPQEQIVPWVYFRVAHKNDPMRLISDSGPTILEPSATATVPKLHFGIYSFAIEFKLVAFKLNDSDSLRWFIIICYCILGVRKVVSNRSLSILKYYMHHICEYESAHFWRSENQNFEVDLTCIWFHHFWQVKILCLKWISRYLTERWCNLLKINQLD